MNQDKQTDELNEVNEVNDSMYNTIVTSIHATLKLSPLDLIDIFNKDKNKNKKIKSHYYTIWIVAIAVAITSLFVTSYNSAVNYKYLSLENSATCTEVTQNVYGTYYGDIYGHWSSEPEYNKDMSIYEMTLQGSFLTTKDYEKVMLDIAERYEYMSKLSTKRDLAWNLIALSTHNYQDEYYEIQFRNRANINNVFNLHTSVFVGNEYGVCFPYIEYYESIGEYDKYIELRSKFNYETSELEVSSPLINSLYKDPVSGITVFEQPCPQHYDIYSDFDYTIVDVADETKITFNINMDTLAIAISSNFGIIDPKKHLNEVKIDESYSDLENLFGYSKLELNSYGKFYVDPHYKNMDPIFCLEKNDTDVRYNMCYIYNGIQLYYPIIANLNILTKLNNVLKTVYQIYNISLPDGIDENTLTCHEQCNSKNNLVHCSQYNFGIGLLFHSKILNKNYTDTIEYGKLMYEMMKEKDETKVIEHFYSTLVRLSRGSEFSGDKIDICNDCTVIGIELYDVLKIRSINENTFELNKLGKQVDGIVVKPQLFIEQLFEFGDIRDNVTAYAEDITFIQLNCANMIYYPDAFERFKTTPPVKLVTEYYECTDSTSDVIINVTLKSYYMGLLITTVFMLTLTLIYLFAVNCNYKTKNTANAVNNLEIDNMDNEIGENGENGENEENMENAENMENVEDSESEQNIADEERRRNTTVVVKNGGENV